MLIRRAEVHGALRDVLVRGRTVVAVNDTGTDQAPGGAAMDASGEVLDAHGGALLPGLHDHHIHLRSAAAARGSVAVGPNDVKGREGLRSALRSAKPDASGWVRAVGYHDGVAGPLDRRLLDAITPDVPVRVQHRSGAQWSVNSRGLALLGMDSSDGVLWRMDAQLPGRTGSDPPRLGKLSSALAACGVTGVTEATPDLTDDELTGLAAAARSGELAQNLHAMAPPGARQHDGAVLGPAKRILDDAALPEITELTGWIRATHAERRAVAIHCVTAVQLVLALAAFDDAGTLAGDRIEHGAVIPSDLFEPLRRLRLTIVTQPNFVAERGDEYIADVPADQIADLWRLRSLRDAGIAVAAGTDAPFGAPDPWAAIDAAARRRTPSGRTLTATETVTPRRALGLFLGSPDRPAVERRIVPGAAADLCLLDRPLDAALAEPDARHVEATIVGGRVVHRRR